MATASSLLTPSPPASGPPALATAGTVVALPSVDPLRPALEHCALLHFGERATALLGGGKAPLLELKLSSGQGKNKEEKPDPANLLEQWIPQWRFPSGVTVTIFSPITQVRREIMGFGVLIQGGSGQSLSLQLSWTQQSWVNFHPRPAPPPGPPQWSGWTHTWAMEGQGTGLALRPPENAKVKTRKGPSGVILDLTLTLTEAAIWIPLGVGPYAEAAALAAVHLARRGGESLLAESLEQLQRLVPPSLGLAPAIRRHALFGHYFTHGWCADRDEEVLVTSRSPRYYVSGAYWARDACWWTLPSTTRLTPGTARRHLELVFSRYLKNGERHALLIDGSVLYDGFELDQLCWPLLAVFDYVKHTGDHEILKESWVLEGVRHFVKEITRKKDPKSNFLYKTFLNSSDDLLPGGISLINNVLVWKLASLLNTHTPMTIPLNTHVFRQRLLNRFTRNGLFVDTPYSGGITVGNNPTLSLFLLPFLGFLHANHPVFRKTAAQICGPSNPFHAPGAFRGEGCAHGGGAWTMGWVSRLLGGFDSLHARKALLNASMDGGEACEAVDSHTGICLSGQAMASAAAFIARPFLDAPAGGRA